MMMTKGVTEWKYWPAVNKTIAGLVIVILVAHSTLMLTMHTDIEVIKSNRFTSSDALALERKHVQDVESLRLLLRSYPSTAPPSWFENQVNKQAEDLKQQIVELKTELRILSAQVIQLQMTIARYRDIDNKTLDGSTRP